MNNKPEFIIVVGEIGESGAGRAALHHFETHDIKAEMVLIDDLHRRLDHKQLGEPVNADISELLCNKHGRNAISILKESQSRPIGSDTPTRGERRKANKKSKKRY